MIGYSVVKNLKQLFDDIRIIGMKDHVFHRWLVHDITAFIEITQDLSIIYIKNFDRLYCDFLNISKDHFLEI